MVECQLGMQMDPANVRLLPQKDDPYYWAALPGKENRFEPRLFQKHLSKLSIGPLMELCHGVGSTFCAFSKSRQGHDNTGNIRSISDAQHESLVNDVLRLKRELKRSRRRGQGLAHQNKRQMVMIIKFRSIAQGILDATASFPHAHNE